MNIKSLERLADVGDKNAQFRLAYHLEFNSKRRNWEKIIHYYSMAAKQGHKRAQFYMGTHYDPEKGFEKGLERNIRKAIYWYRLSAKQKHPVALYNMGICYQQGNGVKKDKVKALACFEQAAYYGDIRAMGEVGYYYFHGEGTKKNQFLGVIWYRKAAIKGDDIAQFNLGLCYLHDEGVVQESRRWALHWLNKAKRNGNKRAKQIIAREMKKEKF